MQAERTASRMAACRIRREAALLEEGGVSIAPLGECASGTPLGMIVDETHRRAKPHHLPRARPFPVGRWRTVAETLSLGEAPVLGAFFFLALPPPHEPALYGSVGLLQVNLSDKTAPTFFYYFLLFVGPTGKAWYQRRQ